MVLFIQTIDISPISFEFKEVMSPFLVVDFVINVSCTQIHVGDIITLISHIVPCNFTYIPKNNISNYPFYVSDQVLSTIFPLFWFTCKHLIIATVKFNFLFSNAPQKSKNVRIWYNVNMNCWGWLLKCLNIL